jgi:hypothetical protein
MDVTYQSYHINPKGYHRQQWIIYPRLHQSVYRCLRGLWRYKIADVTFFTTPKRKENSITMNAIVRHSFIMTKVLEEERAEGSLPEGWWLFINYILVTTVMGIRRVLNIIKLIHTLSTNSHYTNHTTSSHNNNIQISDVQTYIVTHTNYIKESHHGKEHQTSLHTYQRKR